MNFESNSGSFKIGNIPWNKGREKYLDISSIKKEYLENQKSTYDIGLELGVSQKTIENRLKREGFKLRNKTDHTSLTKEKLRIKAIRHHNNMSREEKRKLHNKKINQIPWNKNLKGVQVAWNKGLPQPTEKKVKHSLYMKEYYTKHPEKILLIKQARARQVFPLKDSSIEIKIQNFLKQLKIEFYTHQHMNIEHSYQCDIFIPSMNMVIECDGTYWHSYPTGTEMDQVRTKELLQKGFKVLRLWEFEIQDMDIIKFKELINER